VALTGTAAPFVRPACFVGDARGEIAALRDEVFAILIDSRYDRHARVEGICRPLGNCVQRVAVMPVQEAARLLSRSDMP
jgi:hypothetical protein